jgi:hypothetical protein
MTVFDYPVIEVSSEVALQARLGLIAAVLKLPDAELNAAIDSTAELVSLAARYNQSLDWIVFGDCSAMIARLARQ